MHRGHRCHRVCACAAWYGCFLFFILALKGDADMKPLPKLQKILLWVGVALIIAALIGAPKFWDCCEMRALKAEFDRFVDVENWPEGTEIHMGNFCVQHYIYL